MLESIVTVLSGGVEASAAVGHTPQAAIAAVLCAALVGLCS